MHNPTTASLTLQTDSPLQVPISPPSHPPYDMHERIRPPLLPQHNGQEQERVRWLGTYVSLGGTRMLTIAQRDWHFLEMRQDRRTIVTVHKSGMRYHGSKAPYSDTSSTTVANLGYGSAGFRPPELAL